MDRPHGKHLTDDERAAIEAALIAAAHAARRVGGQPAIFDRLAKQGRHGGNQHVGETVRVSGAGAVAHVGDVGAGDLGGVVAIGALEERETGLIIGAGARGQIHPRGALLEPVDQVAERSVRIDRPAAALAGGGVEVEKAGICQFTVEIGAAASKSAHQRLAAGAQRDVPGAGRVAANVKPAQFHPRHPTVPPCCRRAAVGGDLQGLEAIRPACI